MISPYHRACREPLDLLCPDEFGQPDVPREARYFIKQIVRHGGVHRCSEVGIDIDSETAEIFIGFYGPLALAQRIAATGSFTVSLWPSDQLENPCWTLESEAMQAGENGLDESLEVIAAVWEAHFGPLYGPE